MSSFSLFGRWALVARLALLTLVIGLLVGRPSARAQTGIGTTSPNAKAALDISSTDKGLLIPRLDSAQRAQIVAPPDGLMVFQKNGRVGLWYAFGGTWLYIPDKVRAGDNLGSHTATQPIRYTTNDTDKLLLTGAYGANGPKISHSAGWGFNYYAGPNNQANGSHRFFTGTATGWVERLRIATDGRVGIGTATPAATLDVAGPGSTLQVEGLGNGTTTRLLTVNAAGQLVAATTLPAGTTGDNLGSHTATQNLSLAANALTGTGADLGTAVGLGIRADGGLNLGQNVPNGNILVGYQAGGAITGGAGNQLIGYQSGMSVTAGRFNHFSGYRSGYATTTGNYNQFNGFESGTANTTGTSNDFSGYQSGHTNTTGSFNQFSGRWSGRVNETGSYNYFSGYESGWRTQTGSRNLFIGFRAGEFNMTGSGNTAIGFQAQLAAPNLINATAIGYKATVSQDNSLILGGTDSLAVQVGIGNTAPQQALQVGGPTYARPAFLRLGAGNGTAQRQWELGVAVNTANLTDVTGENYDFALRDATANATRLLVEYTTGNVGIGTSAPTATLDVAGAGSTLRVAGLGNGTTTRLLTVNAAGRLVAATALPAGTTGDNLGSHTATQNLSLAANALTGTGASIGTAVGVGVRADGGLNVGQNTTGNNVLVGYQAGQSITTGTQNQLTGYLSGAAMTASLSSHFDGYQSGMRVTTGNYNHFVGFQSGLNTTIGRYNQFSGHQSGYSNIAGNFNHFDGHKSGYTATGSYNHFSGYNSGTATTTGQYNHFVGLLSGVANTTGSYNQFDGQQSGYSNTTGNHNYMAGLMAGVSSTTGSRNVFVGNTAGAANGTGFSNTALGYDAGPLTGNLTNAAGIGYKARVTQSNSLILGGTDSLAVQVGIGNTAPQQALQVGGPAYARPAFLRLGAGNGATQRQWELGVAVNTANLTDLTGENYDFALRDATIGVTRLLVDYTTGNVGIGVAVPTSPLHVGGNAEVNGQLRVGGNTNITGNLAVSGQLSIGAYVTSTTVPLGAAQSGIFYVGCPVGMRILTAGGGHSGAGAGATISISYNGPDPADPTNSWQLKATNSGASSQNIIMFCSCGRLQ